MLEIEAFFFRCTTKDPHDHIIALLLHVLSEKVLIYKNTETTHIFRSDLS
jgi:hypothetical protein